MKKKIILSLISTVFSIISLSSCKNEITYLVQIDLIDKPKNIYGVGEIIDLSNSRVRLSLENGKVIEYPVLSSEVNVGNFSTETIGVYSLDISVKNYEEYVCKFEYTVIQYYAKLDFNGGTYNGFSNYSVPLYNSKCDLSEIIPINDDPNLSFNGFYFDKECKQRATSLKSAIFSGDKTFTLYAGYDDPSSYSYFTYEVDPSDSYVTITGLNPDSFFDLLFLNELVIPSFIEGYPVKEIGPSIFNQGKEDDFSRFFNISRITFLEDSKVEIIGDNAFSNLFTLAEVTLPNSLIEIRDRAFSGANIKGNLFIPSSVEIIGEEAFAYNTDFLEKVELEKDSKLRVIDEGAFFQCENLRNIEFNENLEEIRKDAFKNCSVLASIFIPNSVYYIGVDAFYGCYLLDGITVDKENMFYSSIDGNLYDKELTRLYRYNLNSKRESYKTLNSLRIIDNGAFSTTVGHNYLKKLEINEGVTTIGSSAFNGCNFDLYLPSTLSSFTPDAFKGYLGNKVEISSSSKHYLSDENIIYSLDHSILYYAPENLNKNVFVLDDRVKTINQNGLYVLNNVEEFVINKESKLSNVYFEGLTFPYYEKLKMVTINKEEPFDVIKGSLIGTSHSLNSSFSIYFDSKEVLNKYLIHWEGLTTAIKDIGVDLKNQMLVYSDQLHNTFRLLANELNMTPYTIFAKDKSEVEATNMLPFNENIMETVINNLDYLYKSENLLDDELLYFAKVEKVIYSDFMIYIDEIASLNSKLIELYNKLIKRISILPSLVVNEIENEYLELSYKEKYANAFILNDELFNEISNFTIDGENFDVDTYDILNEMIEETSFEFSEIPYGVYEKWVLMKTNKLAFEFLNLDFSTHENYALAREYYYGSSQNEYLGIEFYVNNWFKTEFKQSLIYKYDEVLEKVNKVESYFVEETHKISEDITNFDISSFNYETYLTFYNDVLFYYFDGGYSYFVTDEVYNKANYIYESLVVKEYLDLASEVNDGNIVFLYEEIYSFNSYIGANLPVEPYNYSEFNNKLDELALKISENITFIKEFLDTHELTKENLDKFDTIFYKAIIFGNSLYNYLYDENKGNEYFVKYYKFLISKKVDDIISLNEVNDRNYIFVKKNIYGFFDRDYAFEYDGIETLLSKYSYLINKDEILNIEKYEEMKGILDNYLGDGQFW